MSGPTDGYVNGVRPMTAYERKVWPTEFQEAYESTRQLTSEERAFLVRGFLAVVRQKCAAANAARKADAA